MNVSCPTCDTTIVWSQESPYRPFCSKRCQLIDLGEWSNEKMAIPSNSTQNNTPPANVDIEEIEAMLAQQTQSFFKE